MANGIFVALKNLTMSSASYQVEIVPAVLVRSFKDLQESLERIKGAAPIVQIDVVDGIFASTTTWPYKDQAHFDHIVAGDEGMPLWENFDYEFDLMLANPAEDVLQYVEVGATRIVLHARSAQVEEALAQLQPARQNVELPVQVGIALQANATPDDLREFENQFDYIQVMGIEHLGVQGQVLSHSALACIKALRQAHPDKTIQIDGGVRVDNAAMLARAGANRLVAGSAIFAAEDPLVALEMLRRAANR